MAATATDVVQTAAHGERTRRHYAPLAQAYFDSPVHASGPDLDQIEHFVRRHRPARVLDLGCGGGHVAYRAAAAAAEVVACDPAENMLAVVRQAAAARGLAGIRTECASAEALPFAAGSFDMVLSRFSAHHWSDFAAGLREARRVLQPGGQALFVDSVAPARALLDTHVQTLELLRDGSHVRNYRADEWVAALGAAGLRVTSLTPRRLRLSFASWVARADTPPARVEALRAVQHGAAEEVRRHFEIGADGSWRLDTLALEAEPS